MSERFSQAAITAHYRELVQRHGPTPAAAQCSAEGQRFRFAKLLEIGDLAGRHVLDLACGPGDLYPFLRERFPTARYTGIDIVPEMVALAAGRFPEARFLCRDVLADGLDESFDVALLSGVFNNEREDAGLFLEELVSTAWDACREALGFNFISTNVNRIDAGTSYHDPARVLDFCIHNLSRKVTLHHHYERCDVCVFVRR